VETRFAHVGEAAVAYRTFGDGPRDILLFLGEYLPVDTIDEEPRYARAIRRLGSLGRVIGFNRRGVGLSDAPGGPLTHDQNVEDALAVLDHLGSPTAIVFAANLISGAAAMCFAAQHPDRTSALILINTAARTLWATDYPFGVPAEVIEATGEQTTSTEPSQEFDFLHAFAPSVADDARFREWWDRAGNRGASPSRARELWRLVIETDVRDVLPQITAPTLVLRRLRQETFDPRLTRYIADSIGGAKYVEIPGDDLIWWVGDVDAILDEVEAFVAGAGGAVRARRRLATVVFFDVVASTERAASLGDMRWREVLATYHELAEQELARWGGTVIGTAGDGVTTTFEMPADAIRCARSISERVRALDIDVRAGIHTGEIEMMGDDVAGIGVHIAARVQSAATPGEVWVSRTVADLVTGSGISFEDRGEHDLKGVPGRWALFAVKP
jgi:class 3 adenylate cyclase